MTATPEIERTAMPPVTLRGLSKLEDYVVRERFRGYDPYDTLMSPLFRLPVLRSSKILRFGAQQVVRRLGVNLRPLLRVSKGYNPVTLGFVLEASAYLAHVDPDRAAVYRARASQCLEELSRLRSPGYSGDCWGYDFDWEARFGRVPANSPTVVATGIISNSLFIAYRLLDLDHAFTLCARAAQFVLNDLVRAEEPDGTFCWGYFPSDRRRVLNATMKGARLCAQVYSVTGDTTCLEAARLTARYVAAHQRPDGSWPYAVADPRSWADNHHSAYVIDAFDEFDRRTGDASFRETTRRGWLYYRRHFFLDDRIPTLYPQKAYPVDATAGAQSLLTLCRFDDVATALRSAEWLVENMQCSDGHFAYQIRRHRRISTPYMRWSSAYMYAALARLAYAVTQNAELQ
jgi:hypothetical protein